MLNFAEFCRAFFPGNLEGRDLSKRATVKLKKGQALEASMLDHSVRKALRNLMFKLT